MGAGRSVLLLLTLWAVACLPAGRAPAQGPPPAPDPGSGPANTGPANTGSANTGASDTAAQAVDEAARRLLLQRLRRLDLPFTDWDLLRDVGDKVAAAGQLAQPVVAFEVELARRNADPRYRVRLLGVQTRTDTAAAVRELEVVATGGDDELAALAARVLGRVGAPTGAVAALLRERLAKETRQPVRGALILAAGDAGAAESAPLLQVMIEKGALSGRELVWAWTALAQTAERDRIEHLELSLQPGSSLVGAAVLMTRRFALGAAEKPLLGLWKTTEDEPLRTWTLQSLGAVGGEAARTALRASVAADADRAEPIALAGLDARRLALLRLGDRDARAWAQDQVLRAATRPDSGAARVPELFGCWRLDDARDRLREWTGGENRPVLVRASAARGLCWLGDRRGLVEAAAVLETPELDSHDPFVLAGLQLAQATLHHFVDDPDRPDYVGLVPGDVASAAGRGRVWREWLDARPNSAWRQPSPDAADLLRWY